MVSHVYLALPLVISVRLLLTNAHHAQILNSSIKINAILNVLLQLLTEFALIYAKMVLIWMEKSADLAMLIVKLVHLLHSAQAAKELSSVIKDNVLLSVLEILFKLAKFARTVIAHALVAPALLLHV